MPKTLHLDYTSISNDFLIEISKCADMLLDEYYNEIQFQMKSQSGRNDLDAKSLDDGEKKILKRMVIGGAWAIMDSYGTGSLMDKSNPFLAGYMGSKLWNDMRTGYAIAGRPRGQYTNIFGEQAASSGKLAGFDIEDKIPPRAPSKAFQQAEKWFSKGNRINKRLSESINNFFAQVRNNPSKYFRYY